MKRAAAMQCVPLRVILTRSVSQSVSQSEGPVNISVSVSRVTLGAQLFNRG